MSKSIFKSKTFWVNTLTLSNSLLGILPIPHVVPILAATNILLRIITKQPVHIIPQE